MQEGTKQGKVKCFRCSEVQNLSHTCSPQSVCSSCPTPPNRQEERQARFLIRKACWLPTPGCDRMTCVHSQSCPACSRADPQVPDGPTPQFSMCPKEQVVAFYPGFPVAFHEQWRRTRESASGTDIWLPQGSSPKCLGCGPGLSISDRRQPRPLHQLWAATGVVGRPHMKAPHGERTGKGHVLRGTGALQTPASVSSSAHEAVLYKLYKTVRM